MAKRTNLTTLRVISVFLVALGAGATAAGGTIYVDADAGGANNGSSWTDAYRYLQNGLAAALSGDEIRVAEGIYKPDEDSAHPNGTGSRTATFQLKNGVAVKGGYAGFGEADPDARDIAVYETVLSGDLLGNDVGGFDHPSRNENSYHVVTGSGTDETAVLDGFTITAGNAIGNYPQYNGGGMFNDSGSPTLTNCTFSGNSADRSGGGMGNLYSSPTLTNCTFSGNSADRSGGGMHNTVSNPTLTNCTFSGNSASRNGGGMFNESGSPTITNCTFSSNSADNGGGMYNYAGSPTITNCTFSTNSANRGGGMRNWESSPTLTDCTFSGNSAGNGGGGMSNRGESSPTVINCTFSGNSAGSAGGGMYNDSGSPTLTNCTFNNNSAEFGGGMYNRLSDPTVTNSTFSGNRAMWGGGMENESTSNPSLIGCTFKANLATMGGGGIRNHTSSPTVLNCLIVANQAQYGAGIHNENSSSNPTLINCTFSSNSATHWGGGIFNHNSRPILNNCILWANSDNGGLDESAQIHGGFPAVNYCCIQGWTGSFSGIGNINADPLFVDSAIGDYHLLPGSPCIDAGDNSAVPPSVVTDLDGNPRIINGTVDMGAYEGSYQGFLLSAESVIVPEGGTATFTVAPKMDPLGTLEVTVAVESGDPDITVESGGLLTFDSTNYTQPQTVTLAAAEDADELHGATVILVSAPGAYLASVTAYELDSEAPTELYVDCDALGANDGSSWEDAFTELREGLSFAAGTFFGEIRVAQGVYKPAELAPPPPPPLAPTGGSNSEDVGVTAGGREATFQLINGVAVKGGYAGFGEPDSNARDIDVYKTILSGDLFGNDGPDFANNWENSYHVVTGSGTDATAVLDGFTITAGNANRFGNDSGGGMYNDSGSPTVTNCTFSGNSAVFGGGMYNDSGSPTLTNCTFSGNSAGNGGGMHNDESSPTLTNCIFGGNSASAGGGMYNKYSSPTIANCIFSENSAVGKYGDGGGMHNNESNPTLTNCTFSRNSADRYGGAMNSYRYRKPTLTNCILWGNTPEEISVYGRVPVITYSNVQGGWEGEGNIDADPCFVGPGYLNPFSYWKLDETGGTTAYDSVGFNHGNVYGAQWSAGQVGGALHFDGSGDFVSVPHDASLNITGDITISAWVYFIGGGSYQAIVTKCVRSGPQNNPFDFRTNTSAEPRLALVRADASGHERVYSNKAISLNNWHHVLVRVENKVPDFYVDGVVTGKWPNSTFIKTPTGNMRPLLIGARDDGLFFNGKIDEVAIYDRALSAEEIRRIYESPDYHLLPDSPCINAGDPHYVAGPNETDLDGKPRVIGGRIDIGAYEFNHIPVACIVDGNQVVEAEAPWGARVTLDGSCSSDSDSTPGTNDDIVSFDWYKVDACDPNFEDFLASGEVIDCNLLLGEHIIVLEVIDKADAFDTNEVTIIVQDTTPPDFTLSVTPDTLWPANHKMVLITPSWTASDICDASPEVTLVSITMNEGDEAKGDGHTTLNIQIGDDGSIYLRAERTGTGSGRIYTITYQAVDDSGNVAVARATVTVPHDQR